ncbi:MAG TPA: discoidin domain-containing protein, partial [Candidatus Baltobacteraceae bacterium]|nr:discoidin domain-containing protein [Candidatus Baltobacteraceae bacterium]
TSGENVWWVRRPEYTFSPDWQPVTFKKRHIEFAWGPAKDRALKRSASLELAITRGRGPGKGTVCIERLAFRDLPSSVSLPAPVVRASSSLVPTRPADAFDGRAETAWQSDPARGRQQELVLDFGRPREFGGLVLHWLPALHASRYMIDLSDDGEHWRTVRRVSSGQGGAAPHLLTESETRYLRIRMEDGPAKAYGLAEVELKDLAWGASPNAFITALAGQARRGMYPRGFVNEQSYWTVLGVNGGSTQGLLSEDGALEIGPRSGSIEPFLLTDGGLLTWADVDAAQTLQDGYLPIPTVVWQGNQLGLSVAAFAMGRHEQSQLVSRYTVENRSPRPRSAILALALRPFQVNPPTQVLNTTGGVAPTLTLSWDGEALRINGERRIFPLVRPDRVVMAPFESGDIVQSLEGNIAELGSANKSPHPPFGKRGVGGILWTKPGLAAEEETGLASAVLLYRLHLAPGTRQSIAIVAPLNGPPILPTRSKDTWIEQQETRTAQEWRATLNHVSLQLPPAGQPIADTLRTALADILMSRAGPALQPGTRSYARSWIRDGAMMSDALLRLGNAIVARQFAEWFAGHQFANGKVPCCVDWRGADPVAENDSHGEFIHLIAAQYRYSRDRAWLAAMWPRVAAAAAYMDALRAKAREAADQAGQREPWYGLMPASISHEGYADKPAYSYWDDFWTLAGYDDAVEIAAALDREEDARRLASQRDTFRADLLASLTASIARHNIDYLPASADRGDFDPTSTTVALAVAGELDALPHSALQQSFERYWKEFLDRRDGRQPWDVFTPYELRIVGTFVRLGWRARAQELLAFFLAYRRPLGWNQWAEVVGRDARTPRFIGDMPHAWIAADFIQSALDLFAYERQDDGALVLGAGIPTEWFAQPIGIRNLQTPYGALSWTARREHGRLVLTIAPGLTPPPGGVVFRWPYPNPPGRTAIDGHPAQWEIGGELRMRSIPATVTIDIPQP